MTQVVFAEVAENSERSLDVEIDVLGPDVDVVRYSVDGDASNLVAACQDADVILTDYTPFDRDVIQQLSKCRLISVAATGYSCVDVEAAAAASISVCCVGEYCTDEVADHSILLMLALCRRLPEYHEQVQSENRWEFDSLNGLRPLRGQTLGIIGFGRIGQAVARRAQAFGVKVIAFDPFPGSAAKEMGISYCDLATIYSDADIISLHCNLSGDNKQLIGDEALASMRKRPLLINCARGRLIDEEALKRALDSGQIAGAGLDVLEDESPVLKESGLTGRHNVILTPHVAFYSDAAILENRRISTGNIRNFLDGNHEQVRRYVHLHNAKPG